MSGEKRHTGGKPPAAFVAEALAVIRESSHPVTTRALLDRFGLRYTKASTLRRALRREMQLGRLLCVGRVSDGSFAWVPVNGSAAGEEHALLGAAYAAQAFLRERMGDEIGLDIEACKQVIASTLTRRSG
jgi:hypothetical protein